MYTHLLTLIAVVYNNQRTIDLVKCQRCGYIHGFRTLSDLIVGDDLFDKLRYPVIDYDLLYKNNVVWNHVYLPTLTDQLSIYTICKEYFKMYPKWYPPRNVPLQELDAISATPYTRACVAALGALRSLYGESTREIDLLCEDILLLIRRRLLSEIDRLPPDEKDYIRAIRKSFILRKLNK